MSGANTLFSMMQQMAAGLGIAVGAIALRLGSLAQGAADTLTLGDFQLAFCVIV